ncbi:TetR/AcrR family transcriptional regulator [Rhodococcus tukisamuensis]|uniref:TetR/AcrR family transcriptional regulator n=1 Tax=Rhodococcus tukisamuensis TaxID=168276 RepID=UPI0009337887|nr:TetR/AcrR family transcriptional regulator [Rhodococcus tukisamuensis]
MNSVRRVNRGPKAAAENRAAIVAAAREVFAEHGFDVPMSLIARTAGVGQGSLYRHFPSRDSVVLAVFEENIAVVEELALRPDSTLDDLLDALVEQVTTSTAFIAMVRPIGTDDPRIIEVSGRLTALLAGKLDGARRDGAVHADVDAGDFVLALAMFAAILIEADEPTRREVAARAWWMLRRGLRP